MSQDDTRHRKREAMIRSYRYPLEPNYRQAVLLEEWLERCRRLYNVVLEQRRECWRMAQKGLSYIDQTRELTELRQADPRYGGMPVEVCRSPLRTLQLAFEGFFRRVKRGEAPGYPRFKGPGRLDSFGIGRPGVEGRKVRIPRLGLVRFRKHRELGGSILEARVGIRAGRWYVSFSCDIGDAPQWAPMRNPVGIDVGLRAFATLSDGTKVKNPRFFREGEDLLAGRQRALSRKNKGSKGRRSARLLVQKAHEHIRSQRLDFARKLSAELFRFHDGVFYEDLNIRGLAGGMLAKSIQDASWGMFLRALVCKAECAGEWAVPGESLGHQPPMQRLRAAS
jgi:putative transposase